MKVNQTNISPITCFAVSDCKLPSILVSWFNRDSVKPTQNPIVETEVSQLWCLSVVGRQTVLLRQDDI